MDQIHLGIDGVSFSQLFSAKGLKTLFHLFLKELQNQNIGLYKLYNQFLSYGLEEQKESDLLVELAPYVSKFITKLFSIEKEFQNKKNNDTALSLYVDFKKNFVQKRVLKRFKDLSDVLDLDPKEVKTFLSLPEKLNINANDDELVMIQFVNQVLNICENLSKEKPLDAKENDLVQALKQSFKRDIKNDKDFLLSYLSYVEEVFAWLYYYSKKELGWMCFHFPEKLNFDKLVEFEIEKNDFEKITGQEELFRKRDGFALTDKRMSNKFISGEVNYCLYCHEREKDSCSKGLVNKKEKTKFQRNPLGIELKGCPLDEKISEAHLLRKEGDALAALAIIMVDNPLCPGTGHRICNDCMKACIFQKQEPVNIPEIETNTLTEVLNLPYGFEIYSLLTRWNPLNRKRPYALPYNGKNILVVGMGPAGYTLSHYLLNEGFGVVGIDGLKIEPLICDFVGEGFKPIRSYSEIVDKLDDRILNGFGGVAEYGITVRWDKNFLKVIYLNLLRRKSFEIYGGVRFGGTITIEDAWNYGFDHIALATGAGKPTIVRMENNLIRGIRKASDFLMTLQLSGAQKKDSMANLQVRLPAVVIGGGLTGIDTATEIMAYYPIQVEKVLERYESLEKEIGEEKIKERLSDEDLEILEEFLSHGREIKLERKRAKEYDEAPNFIPLIRKWGGVSLVYRKSLNDAPSYRLNHEEVTKAFEEGIYFVEKMSPVKAHKNEYGALNGVSFEKQEINDEGKWRSTGETVKVPAKAMCVAAGTSPNTIYEKEYPGTFQMDEWQYYFKKFTKENDLLKESSDAESFFTSYFKNGKSISFYGDNHPDFAGNVVKAMASAKKGYPKVVELFAEEIEGQNQSSLESNFQNLVQKLDFDLKVTVKEVNRLTPTIVELVVKAPQAAKNFKPGQFYRLQNFEALAPKYKGTKLTMEGIALTGAWTDLKQGLLGLIVLEMGTSSKLIAALKPSDPVIVMGPTGQPTEIPENKTVMLAGGGLGNTVLFSIGQALKEKNNKVVYFAGYKNSQDVFKTEEIEKGTDLVIWSNDIGDPIIPNRKQDKSFKGNIIESMVAYASGDLGEQPISLKDVDRIIAIGSDRMMNAVREHRFTTLKSFLKEDHIAIGSINSSMQCMMKEICAQCLQKHVDPKTGKETKPVFSCFNQDQCLDEVDFNNLNERLKTNHLQEVLSHLWLEQIFAEEGLERV